MQLPRVDDPPCRSIAIGQLIRFGTVGIVSTLIHFVVATTWVLYGSSSSLEANLFGFSAAFTWSFVGNAYWVFRFNGHLSHAFRRFLMTSLLTLLLSVLISLAVDWTNRSAYWGVALTALTAPMLSYLACRYWVFKDRSSAVLETRG